MSSVPERERDYTLGQSYQAEEAKQLDMKASYRTFQKVGLLETSVSETGCSWTGLQLPPVKFHKLDDHPGVAMLY